MDSAVSTEGLSPISREDEVRFSRQIKMFGKETQRKIACATVILFKEAGGSHRPPAPDIAILAAEMLKNLVLVGTRSIYINFPLSEAELICATPGPGVVAYYEHLDFISGLGVDDAGIWVFCLDAKPPAALPRVRHCVCIDTASLEFSFSPRAGPDPDPEPNSAEDPLALGPYQPECLVILAGIVVQEYIKTLQGVRVVDRYKLKPSLGLELELGLGGFA